jgi:hypothetical protein
MKWRWKGAAAEASLISVVALSGCAGEPRVLPPRSPPQRIMPNVRLPAQEIPERHGRVVLDTTDGSMDVAAKYDPTFVPPGGAPENTRSGELCTTPCVVDLPVGKYRLFFSAAEGTDSASGDSDDILVREGLQVYRRAAGRYETPSPADQILPGTVLVLSAIAIPVGAVLSAGDGGEKAVGVILIGAGIAGAIGGGIWAYDTTRATQQAGSSVLFQPGREP